MAQSYPRKRLIKRLSWYAKVEGMNVVMFLGILLYLHIQFISLHLVFLSYGLILMCFILAQGTWYWRKKRMVLEGKSESHLDILKKFRILKRYNIYGMIFMPFVLILQWFISGQHFVPEQLLGWAIFANIFAVLEHINYYHTQLMYDNRHDINFLLKNRSLKKASLFKDLRENKF
jgi:hypothetical protein